MFAEHHHLKMDNPETQINVLKPRTVRQHPGQPWSNLVTPLGQLSTAVRMFGALPLERWVPGYKGIIGHRGYPDTTSNGDILPESTAGAFNLCISTGIGIMETDAAPVKYDEDVRAFHDKTGGRWTDQNVPTEDMDFSKDVRYVVRVNDIEGRKLGSVAKTTNQFVLALKDLVQIGKSAQERARDEGIEINIRWLVDCRDTSAPFAIRDVMRLSESERNFFYIQLLNFGIEGFDDLEGQVKRLRVPDEWPEVLKYVLSPNHDGLNVVAGVSRVDLRSDVHLAANIRWVQGLADRMNVVGLHAPRNGAADDWQNGTGPFKFDDVPDEDRHLFYADMISKHLQEFWRKTYPRKPLISPSALPTITIDGSHYVSTWSNPMILAKLDPEHVPKDYYAIQLGDAAKHITEWGADYVLTDNIPQTAFDLAFHVDKLGKTEFYRSLLDPQF